MELSKNRRSVYKLTYHKVLITKYRYKCINDEIFNYMKQHIERVVLDWGGSVDEINHDYNYVHMLLSLPPQQAPSRAVCSLKTVTSRALRKEFSEYLTNYEASIVLDRL